MQLLLSFLRKNILCVVILHIFYLYYVDDLAKTRWALKKSLNERYRTLESLKLQLHYHEKGFVGKTSKESLNIHSYFLSS